MSTTQRYQDDGNMDRAIHQLHPKNSNKRKRDSPDHSVNRKLSVHRPTAVMNSVRSNGHVVSNTSVDTFSNDPNVNEFSRLSEQIARHISNTVPSTAAAALAASMPQLTVPRPTEFSFSNAGSSADADRHLDSSFDMGGGSDGGQNHHTQGTPYNLDPYQSGSATRDAEAGSGSKPSVGSEEWHKVRRDNHKEVERRRRETINEGINELAKIVPGCEKNKGSILQRGVEYITQLKDNEARNIEKWTLEKLLTDQAIAELSSNIDRLKDELQRAFREIERWKTACQNAGLNPSDDDAGGTAEGGE